MHETYGGRYKDSKTGTSYAVCRQCGATIIISGNNGYDSCGTHSVLVDGSVENHTLLTRHVCRLADINTQSAVVDNILLKVNGKLPDFEKRYSSFKSRLSKAKNSQINADVALRSANAKILREIETASLGRECSRCGVGIGEFCENLTERRNGNKKRTKHPHPQRVDSIRKDFDYEQFREELTALAEVEEAARREWEFLDSGNPLPVIHELRNVLKSLIY